MPGDALHDDAAPDDPAPEEPAPDEPAPDAPALRVVRTGELTDSPTDTVALRALLDAAFDDFDDHDWEHALGGHHVVAALGGRPVGHAAVVDRVLEVDGRPLRTGYVEAVAVHPDLHGRGVGAALVRRAGDLVRAGYQLGGLCTGLDGYYERFGWERWLGPTAVRRGGRTVRSPGSDGLVFVLRHGPSATTPLTATISCDERPGDDW